MVDDNNLNDLDTLPNFNSEKELIPSLLEELFPICRSITGNGVRKSLDILNTISEFVISEIPSGTKCFDWEVPNEWNIDDAFVKDSTGKKIIDFKKNNLHVVSYSIPVNKILKFDELESHLHTNSHIPDSIPYRTSYYNKTWGFCLSQKLFDKMNKNDNFHVVIDSSLSPGSLTYGEYLIEGKSKSEFIISTYCCHPSLANDNLSGMILWILLLKYMKKKKTKFSYRFLIIPETIGAIAYLSKNEKDIHNVCGGFILTCVGGPSNFSYKSTFYGNHIIDHTVENTLSSLAIPFKKIPFSPRGSDERQFSSPGFRIPIGILCKDKFHEYDSYHTSQDNLKFISMENILQSLSAYIQIINNLEKLDEFDLNNIHENVNKNSKFPIFKSTNPKCEPMLSKRGLYPSIGGSLKHSKSIFQSMLENEENLDLLLNTLFFSDGQMSIEQIALKSNLPEEKLYECSNELVKLNLMEKIV